MPMGYIFGTGIHGWVGGVSKMKNEETLACMSRLIIENGYFKKKKKNDAETHWEREDEE